MSKIYKNQSGLRLTLETGINITTASSLKIKYIKPDKTTGNWTATISGTTALYKDFINTGGNSELDQSGLWIFYSFITFSDGRLAPGEAVNIMVYEEGN
jgi:Zn-dependent M28 family amino/carboxypeptidase